MLSAQVIAALIAATVAVTSWFVGQFLSRSRERSALITDAELAFRKRQLEELYGPIYASLKLSARIYPLWLDGHFKEVNADVIALFRKQNDEVVTILKTKAHLIEGSEFPPTFTRYMTAVSIWGMYCSRSAEPWLPPHLASLPELRWPKEFEEHIFTTTEELKRRLDTLLRKYRAS